MPDETQSRYLFVTIDRARELKPTIERYAWLYNHHINQKAIGHQPRNEKMVSRSP